MTSYINIQEMFVVLSGHSQTGYAGNNDDGDSAGSGAIGEAKTEADSMF